MDRYICFVVSAISVANKLTCADIYMHNPRGSNDRLDESGRERDNANRLFDSQNNNRGGYNVGSLYYYAGSKLSIEWTNQHSCGNPNSNCEIIIQYMCADNLRDGATTTTIPENLAQCKDYNCNTDRQYGMQEDYIYYLKCKLRNRNRGLFTADQNLQGTSAKFTRQNAAGTRFGYECPEERDYYPYWHPTPWKDLLVMTNDPTKCAFYQQESQNVKAKGECVFPNDVLIQNANQGLKIPNNQAACQNYTFTAANGQQIRGSWQAIPAFNLPPPDCIQSLYSRDNHLGNGVGGTPNTFNWTVPDLDQEFCAMRIRYNISTGDYEGWNSTDSDNNQPTNGQPAKIDLSAKYNLTNQTTTSRGYVFKNNPQVQMFAGLNNLKLQLAFNTAQFGRTFQDRSHRFAIRPAPADVDPGTVIQNINVRGKRGNIVQVYPAVEYDFVPNNLEVPPGGYVHFQWTGSNTNPQNNDGQGLAGTDRSNVVELRPAVYPEGKSPSPWYLGYTKYGQWGRNYPARIQNTTFLGLSQDDLMNLALVMPNQFGGEMSQLDDAGTYFDLGPRKVTQAGVYYYMCTRNNNFSNRDQKGRISVRNLQIQEAVIGWTGGQISTSTSSVILTIPQGAVNQPIPISIQEWSDEYREQMGVKLDNLKSSVIIVAPNDLQLNPGQSMTLQFKVQQVKGLEYLDVQTSESDDLQTWTQASSYVVDGYVVVQAQRGAAYAATAKLNGGAIAGIVIGIIVFLVLVVLLAVIVVYKIRNQDGGTARSEGPSKGGAFANFRRNFQSKI